MRLLTDINRLFPSKNLFCRKLDGFTKNVITMLAGNIAAQAVMFLSAPLITRLYSVNDFGKMAFVWSLTSILSVVVCMRYESAIVLPAEEWKGLNIFALCVLSTTIICCIVGFVVLFCGETICRTFDKLWLTDLLWFIPLGAFVLGILQCLIYLCTREKMFSSLASARMFSASLTATTKVLLGFLFGSAVSWLLVGNILGPFSALVLLSTILFIVGRKFDREMVKLVNFRRVIDVAREYKKFPIFSMPTGLLNTLSQNIPIILLSFFFPQNIVGYFGLATSVLRKPVLLMGESINKVYFQKIARMHSQNRSLRKSMFRITFILSVIGFLPFCILAFAGKWIFALVFGNKWITAGLYAQILSPWLFLLFINSPATQIIVVKQALRFNFLYNVATFIVRSGAIIITYYVTQEPWKVISAFSICGLIANVFYILYAFSISN